MMNDVTIVGRLTSDPQIKELNGKKQTIITVAVPRNFKNEEGIYETDFIDCILLGNIAENTIYYCSRGDIIGVCGRLQTTLLDDGDGHITVKKLEVVAEKVTFLSSHRGNE